MTKVISCVNFKGGVGKTTIAVALAEFLAEECEESVLFIDLDPQASATLTMIEEDELIEAMDEERTLTSLIASHIEKNDEPFAFSDSLIEEVNGISNLSLFPSGTDSNKAVEELAFIPLRSGYQIQPTEILEHALSDTKWNYNYIVIDCPPSLGTITQMALKISTDYIIPTIPDYLSSPGIQTIESFVEKFAEPHEIEINFAGVVVNKYREQNKAHKSTLKQMRTKYEIFDPVIAEATAISEFSMHKTSNLRTRYGAFFSSFKKLTESIKGKID